MARSRIAYTIGIEIAVTLSALRESTHFCQRLRKPEGESAVEGLGKMREKILSGV
jgi:hypothetical protein